MHIEQSLVKKKNTQSKENITNWPSQHQSSPSHGHSPFNWFDKQPHQELISSKQLSLSPARTQYLSWIGIEALGYLQRKSPRKAGEVLEGEGVLPHVPLSSPQSWLLIYMARSWWWWRRGEAGMQALSGNAIVRERWWLPPTPHGGLNHSEALRITDLGSLINI